jgi:hypothetical protein
MGQKILKTKIVPVLLSSVMVMGLLTGCELPFKKVTSESLIADYQSSLSNLKTASFNVNLDLGMEVSQDTTSIEMGASGIVKASFVKEDDDNYKIKSQSKIKVSLFGISETVKSESYTICDDGDIATYTKSEDDDEWTVEYSDSETTFSEALDKLKGLSDSFVLQEETTTYNDEECYVLKGNFSDILDDIGDMDEIEDLGVDLDDLTMDITLYLNKKTHEPVNATVAISDFYEVESDGYKLSLTSFSISIDISNINGDIKVSLPDEALDAEVTTDSSLIDDILTTTEGDEDVAPPTSESSPISNETTTTPSQTTGRVDQATSLSAYESEGVYFKPYSYGNNTYLLMTNNSSSTKSYKVYATFLKNGVEVYNDYSYLESQGNSFDCSWYYTTEDYDEIVWDVEIDEYPEDLIGDKLVLNDDFTIEEGSLYYEYSGSVTNNDYDEVSFGQYKLVLYDASNNVVGYDWGYFDNTDLKKNETTTFYGYAHVDGDKPTSYKIVFFADR